MYDIFIDNFVLRVIDGSKKKYVINIILNILSLTHFSIDEKIYVKINILLKCCLHKKLHGCSSSVETHQLGELKWSHIKY